ncbi:MAG: hypothetical protein CFK52_00005, partial [Chloracidobacterium sp. CP2_5A]
KVTLKATLQRAFEYLENAYHRVFGCWHTNMSRPFTVSQRTYRMYLNCGAHRAFDTQLWKMVGPYYVDRPRIGTEYQPTFTTFTIAQPQAAALPATRKLRRAA